MDRLAQELKRIQAAQQERRDAQRVGALAAAQREEHHRRKERRDSTLQRFAELKANKEREELDKAHDVGKQQHERQAVEQRRRVAGERARHRELIEAEKERRARIAVTPPATPPPPCYPHQHTLMVSRTHDAPIARASL